MEIILWIIGAVVLWNILPVILGWLVGTGLNKTGVNPLYNYAKYLDNVVEPALNKYRENNFNNLNIIVGFVFTNYFEFNLSEKQIIDKFNVENSKDFGSLPKDVLERKKHTINFGIILIRIIIRYIQDEEITYTNYNEREVFGILCSAFEGYKAMYKRSLRK